MTRTTPTTGQGGRHIRGGLEVRWFPPSWLELRAAGRTVYVDPAWIQRNFASHCGAVVFSHWPEPMDGLPEPDLPPADAVLVTHHHQDHIKTATLRRLCRPDTTVVAPPRCARLVDRPFRAVAAGDELTVANFSVRVVPAHNTAQGRSTRKQHKPGECVGYVVTAAGRSVYHAGDTDLLPEMAALGPVDVAFLPIGGTFTMDVDEAVEAALLIKAGITVPMHHGRRDPADFVGAASAAGLTARALGIGERLVLPSRA